MTVHFNTPPPAHVMATWQPTPGSWTAACPCGWRVDELDNEMRALFEAKEHLARYGLR